MMENIKCKALQIKNKAVAAVTGVATVAASSVVAFAEGTTPTFTITEEMLAPLVEGITANVGVVLPIGLGIFSMFLGIKLVPKLISKFVRV